MLRADDGGVPLLEYRILVGERFLAYIQVRDTDEGRSTVAKMVAALQMEEALKATQHGRGCRINPGGPIMAALGDPEKRPCSCGRDAALEVAKRLQP